MKTVKEVHQEYSKQVHEAALRAGEAAKKNKVLLGLNNISAGDKEALKFLAQLSHTVGGKQNLARLFQIFMAIE